MQTDKQTAREVEEIAKEYGLRVVPEVLSDGSAVFNLMIHDEIKIACTSQSAAWECRSEIAEAIYKAT